MRQAIDRLGIKGSALVIDHGKVLLNYSTDNKADTSYLINSVQKSMTAAMLMREVERGRLSLNDKLARFYPHVQGAKSVKIKNLLDMTAGLDLQRGKKPGTKHYISDAANLKHVEKYTVFNANLLGKWHYTSVDYIYLCGILSKLEKMSYEQLFRQTYIEPLDLQRTEFLWSSPTKLADSNWVPGYEMQAGQSVKVDHAQAVKAAHDELGAGSIVMSNHDLAKTINYILAGDLLSTQSRKELFTGKAAVNFYNGGFYNRKDYKAANGAGQGYYTFLRSSKDGQDMIVIQSNHTTDGRFKPLRQKVNRIMTMMLNLQ